MELRRALLLFLVNFFSCPHVVWGEPVRQPKYIDDSHQNFLENLTSTELPADTLASRERTYTGMVRLQSARDALLVYDNISNSQLVKLTFAGFSEDHTGRDGGYGLHVVWKYELGNKTVFINEHWPLVDGHIDLPNDIRIRSRVFSRHNSNRTKAGSEKDYIFNRFRAGWDRTGNGVLYTEPLFATEVKPGGFQKNIKLFRRVPVSVLTCQGCHSPKAEFHKTFLARGETRNFESIVQNSQFPQVDDTDPAKLNFKETVGYLELTSYLKRKQLLTPEVVRRLDHLFGPKAPELFANAKIADLFRHELSIDFKENPLPEDPLPTARNGEHRYGPTDALSEHLYSSSEGWFRYWKFTTDALPLLK